MTATKDRRWKLEPTDVHRAAVEDTIERTGRKRPDILREALTIGLAAIVRRKPKRRST